MKKMSLNNSPQQVASVTCFLKKLYIKIKISYMNREQQERVADMAEYIQEALTDIINMGEGRDVEVCETEQAPQPSLEQVLHMENKANYSPEISQVNNGFIVQLGCQRFVFETYDKMSKYLKMYFEDPTGTESKFNANELFK